MYVRSELEGLTPAYAIDGQTVTWDRATDGYRLPTEAEWEETDEDYAGICDHLECSDLCGSLSSDIAQFMLVSKLDYIDFGFIHCIDETDQRQYSRYPQIAITLPFSEEAGAAHPSEALYQEVLRYEHSCRF